MWVRGLKQPRLPPDWQRHPVAPYVGAWIETYENLQLTNGTIGSHPMWVRGLKRQFPHRSACADRRSHPMWVRGLKHRQYTSYLYKREVAPYVGAWIETIDNRKAISEMIVAPYVGAWIETAWCPCVR